MSATASHGRHAHAPPEGVTGGSFRLERQPSLRDRAATKLRQQIDMMGTVLGIVVTAIVAFVGLNAMETTRNATNLGVNDTFYDSQQSLVSGVNSAYSLLEVAFIVAILALVIAALVGLRMRR
jgi:ABC-type phosphate transport system permease subunit